MEKKRRVGVMGGTFDPPHYGHLMLAEWAKEEAGLDEVIFLPAGTPYMKEEQRHIQSGEDRFRMTQLAIEGEADFSISDIELSRGGYTYTYQTMEEFRCAHPEWEFFFILGADCLFSMEHWKEIQRLFDACVIIAAARNGSSMDSLKQKQKELEERFHARILLLSFPAVEISSTEIRERIRGGKSARFMLPGQVLDYIAKKGLYHNEDH